MREISLVTVMPGALALCALLNVAPAIAATDEGAEQDHIASEAANSPKRY